MTTEAEVNLDDDLTDEEREALAYQEPEETHVDPNADPAADPEAAPAADPTPDPAADPAAVDPAAATVADAAAQPAAAAEPVQPAAAEEPQAATAPAPILIAEAPADAKAQLDKIAADKAALLDQYESGEITAKELHTKTDALNEQQFEIKQQVREAELARRLNEQRNNNEWASNVNSFLSAHADEYLGDANKDRWTALDHAVKYLNTLPENQGITGPAMLTKAHAFVEALHGKHANAKPAPGQKTEQPKVPRPDIPPTNIGKLPAADANDTSGGEFAAIDALAKSGDVEAYEDTVARLTPAQHARYMAR